MSVAANNEIRKRSDEPGVNIHTKTAGITVSHIADHRLPARNIITARAVATPVPISIPGGNPYRPTSRLTPRRTAWISKLDFTQLNDGFARCSLCLQVWLVSASAQSLTTSHQMPGLRRQPRPSELRR